MFLHSSIFTLILLFILFVGGCDQSPSFSPSEPVSDSSPTSDSQKRAALGKLISQHLSSQTTSPEEINRLVKKLTQGDDEKTLSLLREVGREHLDEKQRTRWEGWLVLFSRLDVLDREKRPLTAFQIVLYLYQIEEGQRRFRDKQGTYATHLDQLVDARLLPPTWHRGPSGPYRYSIEGKGESYRVLIAPKWRHQGKQFLRDERGQVRYTDDGTSPTGKSPLYFAPSPSKEPK